MENGDVFDENGDVFDNCQRVCPLRISGAISGENECRNCPFGRRNKGVRDAHSPPWPRGERTRNGVGCNWHTYVNYTRPLSSVRRRVPTHGAPAAEVADTAVGKAVTRRGQTW